MLTSETSYLQLDQWRQLAEKHRIEVKKVDRALPPPQGLPPATPRSRLPLYLLPFFTWQIRTVAPWLRHSTRVRQKTPGEVSDKTLSAA